MKNLLVILMLGAVQGFAADGGSMPVDPQQKPAAKVVKVNGDYFVDFQDGRMASFTQTIGQVSRESEGLRQIENTCDYDQILSNCRLEMDLAARSIKVEWLKHPDSAKIGQVVKIIYKDSNTGVRNEVPLQEENTYANWFESLQDPSYASKFKPDRIICDNFAWAKDLAIINARVRIDSWASEAMVENPETGTSENLSLTSAFNVTLKKIDDQTFEFEKVGSFNRAENLAPYFSSQVASLTFVDKNKKQCQVSFEANTGELIKKVKSVEFRKLDPQTRTNLHSGVSLRSGGLKFHLRNLKYNLETE